jgi:hypothetical protein
VFIVKDGKALNAKMMSRSPTMPSAKEYRARSRSHERSRKNAFVTWLNNDPVEDRAQRGWEERCARSLPAQAPGSACCQLIGSILCVVCSVLSTFRLI